MAHPYWPLFDLRIRSPRLELRAPSDDDLCALAALAAEGIHDPAHMPFRVPWTDASSPTLERRVLQHGWRARAEWTPEAWDLPLAVVADGEVVGLQALHGRQFAVMRRPESGSWLGRRHQGRGIGTEMRLAVLELAFVGLGALGVTSGAFVDNPASRRVSDKLGYEANGIVWEAPRGVAVPIERLLLTRTRWEETRRAWPISIELSGLEPCLELFGVAACPA